MPTIPTLKAAATGPNSVKVSWSNVSGETAYELHVSKAGGSFSFLVKPAKNVVSYEHKGLQPGTDYVYRVRSIGPTTNSKWSSHARATTHEPEPVKPAAPTNLRIVYESSFQRINAQWDPVNKSCKVFVNGQFAKYDSNGQTTIPYSGLAPIRIGVTVADEIESEMTEATYTPASAPTPIPTPTPTPTPENPSGALARPRPAQPTRVVKRGSYLTDIGRGEVVALQPGVLSKGVKNNGGILMPIPELEEVTLTGTANTDGGYVLDCDGNESRVCRVKFDAEYGDTKEIIACKLGCKDPYFDFISWTDRLSGVWKGAEHDDLVDNFVAYGCGSDAVLGGARNDNHNVYGYYFSSKTGRLRFAGAPGRPFKMVVLSNFVGRSMMTRGYSYIEDFYFQVMHPDGRMLGVRGTEGTSASFILQRGTLKGAPKSEWWERAAAGAQLENGGDTDTGGVDQTCAFFALYDITFDTMDILQMNASLLPGPADKGGRNFELKRIRAINHIGGSLIDLKKNQMPDGSWVSPKGLLEDVKGSGPTLTALLNTHPSTVTVTNCSVEKK